MAKTIVQDEGFCLIFGMPKQVIRNGDAYYTVSLFGISKKILEYRENNWSSKCQARN